jgi:uncharacterized damage-inducible protein DinB
MPETGTLFEEALEAWRYAREGVIAEVENVPEELLERRPPNGVRTVGDLARHVVGYGRLMAGELSRADGDLQRRPPDELYAEHAGDVDSVRGKAALLELLRTSHEEGDRRLRQAGEIRMLQQIRQFSGTLATRFSWMHHGIAHEEYHRGQIALTARLLGRVPALTQLIERG